MKSAAVVILAMTAAWLTAAVTDPAAGGPYPAVRVSASVPATNGATLSADVYYPGTLGAISPEAGQCDVIVLGHGFSQSKAAHVNQGLHLASRGFIVIIPNSNSGSDHSRFADDLRKCIDWIEARNADPSSLFHGRVRAGRAGATGHSAGGLSAIVAAARDPRIRAVAPMDPVDSGGLGVAALGDVRAPLAITYSEPSSCNANGSAEVLYAAAGAPKRGMRIIGANHTDPQDPASFLSALVCGGANSARQALYRRYVTGWFEYHLRGDERYGPWVFNQPGGQVAADLAAGRVTYAEEAAPLAAWRFANFGADSTVAAVSGDEADPDQDGLRNLQEYAFGTDPLAADGFDAVTASLLLQAGQPHLALTFPLVTAASDITCRVEASGDLGIWTEGSTYSGLNRVPYTAATSQVALSGAGLESVTVRDNTPADTGPRFLRLQLTRP